MAKMTALERLRAYGPDNLTRTQLDEVLASADALSDVQRGFVERTLQVYDTEGIDAPETPAQRRKRRGQE